MALEGDLSEFPLTDIIQLVDLSKKTGGVHLRGKRASQEFEGWLYFRDGKIIGADLPGMPPLEAVYTFFTLASGPFRFHEDSKLDAPTITVSNEVIIMEGIMRQDAWAHIQQYVPSLNIIPRLVPNPSTGTTEINLEAEEWRVLTMVNGRNTVAQIALRSGLGEFRTCEIIAQLLANGLIEKRDSQPGEALNPDLEKIAERALGPTAGAVMQESFQKARVSDPAAANGHQLLTMIDHFEISAARVIGTVKARQVAAEMRERVHDALN